MNNYYLTCILLKDCPYSISANNLLKEYKINSHVVWINNTNKKEKEKYKTDKISTFPQIYLKKKNTVGNILIGGYSELKTLVDLVYKKSVNDDNINIIMNKYNYSKKTCLRIIQLINNINL